MTRLEDLFASRVAMLVPDVVAPALATQVRARFARTGYAPYRLVDRGHYDDLELPPGDLADTGLRAAVLAAAARATGRSLVITELRAIRLLAGDYVLAHHDRPHAVHLVEAIVDLSAAVVPGAEVHWRDDDRDHRGGVFLTFPSTPGAAAIVERSPAARCNHTYVGKRTPGAEVVRLVARLREA